MEHHNQDGHAGVHMPLPTVWPVVLALGVALLIAGMVTHLAITLLGLLLTVLAIVGWFRNVLPEEAAEIVDAPVQDFELATPRTFINRLPVDTGHRKVVPVESFRFSTGLLGGLAGGVAMLLPAELFSLLKYHSLWYAMNLLAAGGFVDWANQSNDFLAQFHMQGFLAALAIHALASILVGSLYGALLPMFPRWPILTAGFLAPLLWTGLLASALNVISPILNQRIDWFWFVASQIAFGLVAGFVVNLQAKVRTPQFQALPFAVRAGFHANLGDDSHGKDGQH